MLYFGGGYPGLSYPPPALVEPEIAVPVSLGLIVEIPMRVVTGDTTRPAIIHQRIAQLMKIYPLVTVPMARGMSERAEIPMRALTHADMERD